MAPAGLRAIRPASQTAPRFPKTGHQESLLQMLGIRHHEHCYRNPQVIARDGHQTNTKENGCKGTLVIGVTGILDLLQK